MCTCFVLTFRFLQPLFHGRGDMGTPEWPPSPLRVFQALVAAAHARDRGRPLRDASRAALSWLEHQPPPDISAAPTTHGAGYRLSVPNNAMDVVAAAWSRGNEPNSGDANPATHRTMKPVRPIWLQGDDSVRYAWRLGEQMDESLRPTVSALESLARDVVALGWGIDLAVGHGAIMNEGAVRTLPGEQWVPTAVASEGLRVPVAGTLEALETRHDRFVKRLDRGTFVPAPPLTAYKTVAYQRAAGAPHRQIAAFSLRSIDSSAFRSFDAVRRALTVSGMARHATRRAAERARWTSSKVAAFILGHGEALGDAKHVAVGGKRFAFLPLPTIESRGEGRGEVAARVRRIIITAFDEGCAGEIAWARRSLSGAELVDEARHQPVAVLEPIPATDNVLRHYTRAAAAWATVTPVVLPGYDDPDHLRRRLRRETDSRRQIHLLARLDRRVDGLIRKAIQQAGFSSALADSAEIEWRHVGYWPGTELATRYGIPDHLRRFSRVHVRLTWRNGAGHVIRVPGPICIGGGRFAGVGLFAAVRETTSTSV